MISSTSLTFVLAAVSAIVSAAPFTERDLNSTIWTPEHILKPDDVILYGDDGRMEVVHKSVYYRLMESQGITIGRPETKGATLLSDLTSPLNTTLEKRDVSCDDTFSYTTDGTQKFVDWDVQMSPVVLGYGPGIDVSVTSGFTASNSFGFTGLPLIPIKKQMSLSLLIDYSKTWTTQAAVSVKGTIPNRMYGVFITKPNTVRRYGRWWNGCLGNTRSGTWYADSHAEGSYAGIKWISGTFAICAKRRFPLTFCEGSGTFI